MREIFKWLAIAAVTVFVVVNILATADKWRPCKVSISSFECQPAQGRR